MTRMRSMTPVDNRVYNALIEWLRRSHVHIVAVSIDHTNRHIVVYSDKCGQLVGKAGSNIYPCKSAIADCTRYKDYTIELNQVDFFLSSKDKPVSDRRYLRECAQYLNSFFALEGDYD